MGITFCKLNHRHDCMYGDSIHFSYGGYSSFKMNAELSDIDGRGQEEQKIIERMFGGNYDELNEFTPRECKIARKFIERNIGCFSISGGADNMCMAKGLIHLLKESNHGIKKF